MTVQAKQEVAGAWQRKLYWTCIITVLPALPLSIPYCALTGHLLPALGLLPHGFSALLAAYRLELFTLEREQYQIVLNNETLTRGRRVGLGKKILLGFADLSLALSLLVCIIFSFVEDHRGSDRYLISFAAEPMMVNCGIHFFLSLVALASPVFSNVSTTGCPRCGGCSASTGSSVTTPLSESDHSDHGEGEGRPSIDCVA